jgi:hypothetical protein
LLELMRLNRVRVRQVKPFDVILIESDPHDAISNDQELDQYLAEKPAEEKADG